MDHIIQIELISFDTELKSLCLVDRFQAQVEIVEKERDLFQLGKQNSMQNQWVI